MRTLSRLSLLLTAHTCLSWTPVTPSSSLTRGPTSLRLIPNILSDIGDALFGDDLSSTCVAKLPYGKPLDRVAQDEEVVLAVQERGVSFTGEDYDVWTTAGPNPHQRYWVRGALLHLPGKSQQLRILNERSQCLASIQRKTVAIHPTYDIYRGNLKKKIGWISKKPLTLVDTFEVFSEDLKEGPFGQGGSPLYKIEGDFVNYRFTMRDMQTDQVVAKVKKEGWVQFDAFNHYQISVSWNLKSIMFSGEYLQGRSTHDRSNVRLLREWMHSWLWRVLARLTRNSTSSTRKVCCESSSHEITDRWRYIRCKKARTRPWATQIP